LPDDRKAEITVRHLLNMASGLSEEQVPLKKHYEWALGHDEKSPFAKLKDDPGKKFHYSNAGVAHLVLVFHRATGVDLFPFLKERILDPIGVTQIRWTQVGGDGGIGPFSQGFSGVMTNPREHARFCTLALHKGMWDGKRLVPETYYDFAWKSSPANPSYGAQWWVYPKFSEAPRDLVQTAGARNNHGYVIPSLDLVVVRVGDGNTYPKDFEKELIAKILAAVDSPSGSK
jgi:CubicO group peptidase (beta-lactamase class C family)